MNQVKPYKLNKNKCESFEVALITYFKQLNEVVIKISDFQIRSKTADQLNASNSGFQQTSNYSVQMHLLPLPIKFLK